MFHSPIMGNRPECAWRTLLMAFTLATTLLAAGQNRFTVNGRLKIEGGDLSGARAVVYKNGQKERTVTSGLNKFSLDLELNQNYLISFEKDGYVSKKLSFNTKVPAEAMAGPFTAFDYGVSLFKQYDDINIVVFNQPVGVIRYEPSQKDFDYDTDYTRSIQSQLQEVLAAVDKKQKEEARNEKANAKKAASDDKAQAKAEAKKAQEAAELARQQEAARKAQEEAQAKAAAPPETTPAEPEPMPEAPPAVQAPRVPSPPPGRPMRKGAPASAMGGEEGRRMIRTMNGEESSPVAPAEVTASLEERPAEIPIERTYSRNEELLVEPTRVVTIVRLGVDDVITEYRRVAHKWGDIFYFKDGKPCTALVYQTEAMGADRLVSAGQ